QHPVAASVRTRHPDSIVQDQPELRRNQLPAPAGSIELEDLRAPALPFRVVLALARRKVALAVEHHDHRARRMALVAGDGEDDPVETQRLGANDAVEDAEEHLVHAVDRLADEEELPAQQEHRALEVISAVGGAKRQMLAVEADGEVVEDDRTAVVGGLAIEPV